MLGATLAIFSNYRVGGNPHFLQKKNDSQDRKLLPTPNCYKYTQLAVKGKGHQK